MGIQDFVSLYFIPVSLPGMHEENEKTWENFKAEAVPKKQKKLGALITPSDNLYSSLTDCRFLSVLLLANYCCILSRKCSRLLPPQSSSRLVCGSDSLDC